MEWLLGGALVPLIICGGMCAGTAVVAAAAARRDRRSAQSDGDLASERVPAGH